MKKLSFFHMELVSGATFGDAMIPEPELISKDDPVAAEIALDVCNKNNYDDSTKVVVKNTNSGSVSGEAGSSKVTGKTSDWEEVSFTCGEVRQNFGDDNKTEGSK